MKKTSFIERVLAYVTGGDESKLVRFSVKLEKFFAKQIKQREETIDNLKDKIVDAKEALNETILGVDLDSINKTDGAEGYCPTYVKAVQFRLEEVSTLESKIEDLQAEIDELKKTQSAIYGAVEAT